MRDTGPRTTTTTNSLASISQGGHALLQSPREAALIDAAEFARELSVSKPTIWRLLAAQRIPEPIRLTAQCLRWRRDEVAAWIAAGCPSLNEERPAATNGEASKNPSTPFLKEVTR